MKSINKLLLAATLLTAFIACNKVADLPLYKNGTATVLSASSTNVAPAPSDSDKVSLTLNWTNPHYATDTATYKFVIDIDSSGKNFASPASFTVTGAQSKSFISKDLNTVLLAKGYAFNVPVSMDVRLTSSYANNNEQLASNVITIKMTPYKVPPIVPLPTTGRLFITGDATDFGWSNPAPMPPERELARLDETTWGGIFHLSGSGAYILLPLEGNWDNKYNVADGGINGLANGGSFGFNQGNANIPGNVTSGAGWYKLIFDFQHGKFTATPYTSVLPVDLFIVGDATAWGWNNPVPVPLQQFTRLNSAVWEISLPLIGGNQYLILSTNGDWSKKYTLKDNSVQGIAAGGEFGYHADGQPAPDDFTKNFLAPSSSGTFKITVNYAAPTTIPGAAGIFTVK